MFRIKRKPDGEIDRYKARLVARGFSQIEGIDFDETYSPVARYDTIRTLIGIAAAKQMSIIQFDVATAFLNGDLHEEIYVEQPKGYQLQDNDGNPMVWRLNKALYGLRQAPRCWYRKFSDYMATIGLERSTTDTALFFNNDRSFYLILYVDDALMMSNNQDLLNEIKSKLSAQFKMKFHDPDHFVGIQIKTLEDGSIKIHQESYCRKILDRFRTIDGSDWAAVKIPADPQVKLSTYPPPTRKDEIEEGSISSGSWKSSLSRSCHKARY